MNEETCSLPRPLHIVTQQVASYFKVPYKKLRLSVDALMARDHNTAVFDLLEESELGFDERFYCSAGKFNLASLWTKDKLLKSTLYQDYLHYLSSRTSPGSRWAYCIGGSSVLVLTDYPGDPPILSRGASLIYISHGESGGTTIEPLKNFLSHMYPLPPL